MHRIEFNGKSIETNYFTEISDEQFEEIREAHYKKPPFEKVQKQLISISNGSNLHNLVSKYYIKDIMEKSIKRRSKFSVEEAFASKDLMGFLYAKAHSNKRFYNSDSLIRNIETVCRLGATGTVQYVSDFPMYAVDEIIQKYNKNNIVYDFSCGWGVRLLGALRNHVKYCGTDPNYLLVERLIQMSNDYQAATGAEINIDIRAHGSERFVTEWVGQIGLAFSSPPYYDEEDYVIGDQSYNPTISYESWLNNYMDKTMSNIWQYLIDDGVMCINVKNLRKHPLENDTKEIAVKNGFKLIATETLSNNKRPNEKVGLVDNSENIFVFAKQ